MKTNIKNEENNSMNYESLIQRLRSQDAIIIKKNRMMIIFSIIILLGWGIACISNHDYDLIATDNIFNMFVFILLTLILIYRILHAIKFKRINYADSVMNSLKSAEKRYQFWNTKMIFEFIMLLVTGIILGYFIYNKHVEDWSIIKNLIVSIMVPISVGTFSMVRSYKAWERENKPLWISAKNLLKEFE